MTGLAVPLLASGSSALTVNTTNVAAFFISISCKFISIFE